MTMKPFIIAGITFNKLVCETVIKGVQIWTWVGSIHGSDWVGSGWVTKFCVLGGSDCVGSSVNNI